MKISEVDINCVSGEADSSGMVFYDCRTAPFELTGLAVRKDGKFSRFDDELEKQARDELVWLASHTSGAMVRFRTSGSRISLRVKLPGVFMMYHMPLTGSSGFDIYNGDRFQGLAAPSALTETEYERTADLTFPADSDGMHDITIGFPLYNSVTSLEIGLEKDRILEKPKKHKHGKVVFYGSSITQGGVASRPGCNYANILARQLDFELVNLGFSGNAFGDSYIADYIASMPMAAFVMDYDFNARSLEELDNTHLPMYRAVREKQPGVPIIFMTNPVVNVYISEQTNAKRAEIIMRTYQTALDSGDRHVAFIDGHKLLGTDERDSCTTDRLHPNDLGFMRMAQTVYPYLSECSDEKRIKTLPLPDNRDMKGRGNFYV